MYFFQMNKKYEIKKSCELVNWIFFCYFKKKCIHIYYLLYFTQKTTTESVKRNTLKFHWGIFHNNKESKLLHRYM